MQTYSSGLFALLLLIVSPAAALKSSEAHQRMIQAKRLSSAPRIDGILDDVAWSSAAKIEGFYQWTPSEGTLETEKTIAYIGYDDKYLYVAFEAFDSTPTAVRAALSQRDQIGDDDLVWISLDPFNDHRTGYEFICNPLGVQEDAFMTPSSWDTTFDAVWKSAGRLTSTGYVVEMAIPFQSIRFPKKQIQDWGIQFHRVIRRKGEHISWSPVFNDLGHYFYQMGLMRGLEKVKPGNNLEVIPEITAYKNPGQSWGNNVGVNLKYKPSPNLALDATYKPDFSQVELDPVRPLTNLRFPVFIPEKRPFFMERADIFSTPIQVVNTRSIVSPYWGAKLAGKIDAANVGALVSRDKALSPNAGDYIGRANFDVGQDDTVGFVGTDREMAGASNRVGGIDSRLRWADVYSASLQGLGSHALNPDGSTQNGKAIYAQFARNTHALTTNVSYTDIDPSFRADLGFIPRVDIRNPAASAGYLFYVEQPWLTSWGPGASYSRIYSHHGDLTDEANHVELDLTAPMWNGSLSFNPQNLEKFNGTDFRKNSISLSASASPAQYFISSLSATMGQAIHYTAPIELGQSETIDVNASLRPFHWLRLETEFFITELRERSSNVLLSDQNTLRETVRLQCTREWSLRVITDWTRIIATPPPSSRVLTVSALSGYVLNPGTVLYAGFDIIRQSQDYGSWGLQDQMLFLKMSYLFVY